MAALTGDRDTKRQADPSLQSYPVKAATKIYAGSYVVMNSSGFAEPATAATGKTALGRAEHQADNSAGSNGDISILVRRGCFCWANSASSDLIALSEVGKTVYLVDDQTVAKTDGSSARSAAGIVRNVDASGVWVEV
ncbi:MAG: hypothetical protein ACT7A5_16020 [Ferrovibrionaceae bacterium]